MAEIKYSGRLFQIVHTTFGDKTFEVARRAPGTRLIIELPNGNLLLTKEFRRELNKHDYRLPGGKVFDTLQEYTSFLESGKPIESAALTGAKKEGREEVGIVSGEYKLLGKSTLGATVEWDLYYYIITNPILDKQATEEGEEVTLMEITKSDAKKYCLNGSISEERSALRLLQYLDSSP